MGKKHGMFPRPQEESDSQSHTDIASGTTPDICTGIFSYLGLQKYLATTFTLKKKIEKLDGHFLSSSPLKRAV